MADKRVLQIFDELKELHIAKDSDYAGEIPLSNFRRSEQFGIPAWKGCLIRMSDKWSRIASLVGKGENAVVGESLEDSLRDLAVYSIITVALLSEQNGTVAAPEEVKAGLRMHEERIVGSRPTWDEAKWGPVSTQEEIGDRWKDAEKDG